MTGTNLELTKWIRSRASDGAPLNLHSVIHERPDIIELAYHGETPRGWFRSLLDADVDPYKIVHSHEDHIECAICGLSFAVLGSHLKKCHGIERDEYLAEFGPDAEVSSESFRATQFRARPIHNIKHWERLWSRCYVIDWIIRLKDEGYALNFHTLNQTGQTLTHSGLKFFGSWDAALQAAGLDANAERAIPPFREWTDEKVIEEIWNFMKIQKEDPQQIMPNSLRMAIGRRFDTPEQACIAAGIDPGDVLPRAIFKGETVTRLVASIRALEPLKGGERKRKLDAIYRGNTLYQRIIVGHFGSLRKLAEKEGIPFRVVAPVTYRDEADVIHDLDFLESNGVLLNFSSLKGKYRRLYNVIRETGWGTDRLTNLPQSPRFPPYNPRSNKLHDKMIMFRRRLQISMKDAAAMAGLSVECWSHIEKDEGRPKASTVVKIERLLADKHAPSFIIAAMR